MDVVALKRSVFGILDSIGRRDAMEGFDTMTMSYLGNPGSAGILPHSSYLQSAPGMDIPDHLSNFDADPYMRLVARTSPVLDCFCADSVPVVMR